MLRLLKGSIMGGAAALALSACSLVVDSGSFTGGDGGIQVDRDGDTPGLGELSELLDVESELIEQWCQCHEERYASMQACVDALSFGSSGYASCLQGAYPDVAADAVQSALQCQLEAARDALQCQEAASCASPGEHYQCFLARQSRSVAPDCMPPTEEYTAYFNAEVQCAMQHRVGTGAGCPPMGSAAHGSTFFAETPGAGNDFDFSNPSCFTNAGAADVALWWQSRGRGPVVVDTIGSTFDTALYHAASCTDTTGSACNVDMTSGIFQSRLELEEIGEDETLLWVVDAFSPADLGAVRLNVTSLWCLDELPDAQSTEMEDVVQLDITSAVSLDENDPVFEGNLDEDSDSRFAPQTCGDSSVEEPEVVVAWRAPVGGTYRIDTGDTGFDNVLYLRRSCDAESDDTYIEDACDDGDFSAGEPSVLEVSLMAEETIVIVVDSKGEGSGSPNYEIYIEPVS